MNVLHSFQNRKYKNIFIISSIAAAIIATVLRTVGILFFYEKETAYFEKDAALPIVLWAFIALSLVVFAVCSVFTINRKEEISSPSKYAKYAAVLPAAAMLVFIVKKVEELAPAYENYLNGFKMPFIYSCGILIAAAFCILFFLAFAFMKTDSSVVLFSSVAFFAWGIFDWITSYIEFMTPINSPDKLFFHLACISIILFMISELRAIHGFAKPKFYYFSLAASILTLSVSSIPCVIGAFTESFKNDLLFAGNIVMLTLLAFVITRAVTLILQKEPEKKIEEAPAHEEKEQETTETDDQE